MLDKCKVNEMNFKDKLNRFEGYLETMGHPALKALGSGIPIHIQKGLTAFLGHLPNEFYTLFEWRNGLSEEGAYQTLGSTWLFPLGTLCDLVNSVEELPGWTKEYPKEWKNKFPIFESGGGEKYLIDYDIKSDQYGSIHFFSLGHTQVELDLSISIYDNLGTWIDTMLECYSSKAYFIHNNTLKENSKDYVKIGEKLNPKSEFWKFLKD